jgi:uncharacterized protein involved in response to NO
MGASRDLPRNLGPGAEVLQALADALSGAPAISRRALLRATNPARVFRAMWRRQPFRLLFPLGAVLGWIGVLPWLFFAFRARTVYEPFNAMLAYRSYLHPLAELEGFLGCFALGLAFTAVPAASWELCLCLLAPLCAAALALAGRWPEGQVPWLFLVVMTAFKFRRTPGAAWLFAAALFGIAGAGLAGVSDDLSLRELGRDLVMQGMFTALCIGAARGLRGDRRPHLFFDVLAIALFAAGFAVAAPHLAFAVRALVLIAVARPLRPPFEPGYRNLRPAFAHLALWMTAFGTAWIALFPHLRRAGLHVLFLGAFVSLLCAGFTTLGEPVRRIVWTAALFTLSMMGRAMVELDPQAFHLWMGVSAAAFLAGSALCAMLPWMPPEAQPADSSRRAKVV